MGNGFGAGLRGDLDQAFGDERTRDAGSEEILALVDRVGAEHRVDEVGHELLGQVLDVDLPHAKRLRLGAGRLHLFALADVRGERHHFGGVGLLQPVAYD